MLHDLLVQMAYCQPILLWFQIHYILYSLYCTTILGEATDIVRTVTNGT